MSIRTNDLERLRVSARVLQDDISSLLDNHPDPNHPSNRYIQLASDHAGECAACLLSMIRDLQDAADMRRVEGR